MDEFYAVSPNWIQRVSLKLTPLRKAQVTIVRNNTTGQNVYYYKPYLKCVFLSIIKQH